MRRALVAAFLVAAVPAEAVEVAGRSFLSYVPQTSRVEMACFPKPIKAILANLSKQFGKEVVVTSGVRSGRGTRKGSYHRKCLAADVRIPGVGGATIAKVAKAMPGIGGVGTYCGRLRDMVHVDVGPRREWRHCGRKRR